MHKKKEKHHEEMKKEKHEMHHKEMKHSAKKGHSMTAQKAKIAKGM